MRITILTIPALALALACDDPGADHQVPSESLDLPATSPAPEPSPEPSTSKPPEVLANLGTIDTVETAHTLTLVARDNGGEAIGVLVMERRDLEAGEDPAAPDINEPADPTWFPVHASGHFDIRGLSDDAASERITEIEARVHWHPVESLIGCAIRIAAAAALCMDGPAVVVTCPVGLHGVMCQCGPEVGIKKTDLAPFCEWD